MSGRLPSRRASSMAGMGRGRQARSWGRFFRLGLPMGLVLLGLRFLGLRAFGLRLPRLSLLGLRALIPRPLGRALSGRRLFGGRGPFLGLLSRGGLVAGKSRRVLAVVNALGLSISAIEVCGSPGRGRQGRSRLLLGLRQGARARRPRRILGARLRARDLDRCGRGLGAKGCSTAGVPADAGGRRLSYQDQRHDRASQGKRQ